MSVPTIPAARTAGRTTRQSTGGVVDLTLQGHTVVAQLHNHDDVALTVHARSFTLETTPSSHTVAARSELKAAWQCRDAFDLSVHGPWGSYRHISGRCDEPQVEARLRQTRRGVRIQLFNPHRFEVEVLLADGIGLDRALVLPAFGRHKLAVQHRQGAYEATVTLPGTDSRQVLAGHL